VTISPFGRIRRRREERERRRAALAAVAAAFGAGRRVLLDGAKAEGMYDVIASEDASRVRFLNANGIFITTEPPRGFASVQPFGGDIHVATNDPRWRDPQLHLGCGPLTLPGWINIDNLPYPGVDLVWDLARGIPLRNARFIFAEHFIEHLTLEQSEQLVRNCRAALRDDGILRLSTPNLDWVWQTSYHPYAWRNGGDALADCFVINRAFHGWGHRFLYNFQTLENVLQNAGFETIRRFRYGESDTPALTGIERHEPYPDTPELPHMVIVEATGRRTTPPDPPHPMMEEYRRDVAVR
jgi:predicted SAM-dependent methyltransferase